MVTCRHFLAECVIQNLQIVYCITVYHLFSLVLEAVTGNQHILLQRICSRFVTSHIQAHITAVEHAVREHEVIIIMILSRIYAQQVKTGRIFGHALCVEVTTVYRHMRSSIINNEHGRRLVTGISTGEGYALNRHIIGTGNSEDTLRARQTAIELIGYIVVVARDRTDSERVGCTRTIKLRNSHLLGIEAALNSQRNRTVHADRTDGMQCCCQRRIISLVACTDTVITMGAAYHIDRSYHFVLWSSLVLAAYHIIELPCNSIAYLSFRADTTNEPEVINTLLIHRITVSKLSRCGEGRRVTGSIDMTVCQQLACCLLKRRDSDRCAIARYIHSRTHPLQITRTLSCFCRSHCANRYRVNHKVCQQVLTNLYLKTALAAARHLHVNSHRTVCGLRDNTLVFFRHRVHAEFLIRRSL